jgi:hypothetical protein
MSISKLLEDFRTKYERHGEFTLTPELTISTVVEESKVPNEFGIYVISSLTPLKSEIVYVGKAGTIKVDGKWKRQGLSKRLTNKQGKENRNKFFRNYILEEQLIGLHFEWFVTFDNETSKVLPLFAEAQLIQAFFNENHRLPKLNTSA